MDHASYRMVAPLLTPAQRRELIVQELHYQAEKAVAKAVAEAVELTRSWYADVG